jgi:hypothetical protein
MCVHAILRVKYLAEKASQLIEVDSERALQQKLLELKGKDQVQKVSIYPCHHHVVLTKEWKEELYVTPADDKPVV